MAEIRSPVKIEKDFIGPSEYDDVFFKDFGVQIIPNKQKITFNHNTTRRVHRWSPYVQGFSADFVDKTLDRYEIGKENIVLDPFVGSGTVVVSTKMRGIEKSIGVDLNPLLAFMARIKTNWDVDVPKLKKEWEKIPWNNSTTLSPPEFLEYERHFNRRVLRDLLALKESILRIPEELRSYFELAFVSILIDCSNLKRGPCLGYPKKPKKIPKNAVKKYFNEKMQQIVSDLEFVQTLSTTGEVEIIEGDSREVRYEPNSIDIAITSPPYASGMDYVINYKIEMAWLDFIKSHKEAKKLKDRMVVCDNVSRGLTKEFAKKDKVYSNEWLEYIVKKIKQNINEREKYRRKDMHLIVHKYFDDLFQVMGKVYDGLKDGGRFVLVVGDSLIADVYVPTDLLIAKIGSDIGFEIESVEIARERRSGQRRDFRLRETITSLTKGEPTS